MSMNVGSSSGSDDPEVMMDINTTPLIDVMLVLLIMLIITIPIQLHAVDVNLPTGNPPPPLIKPEKVKIDIDARSQVYWNGELVPDRVTLEQKMTAAAAQPLQPQVILWPNKSAKYDAVAAVLASAQRTQLRKIGFEGFEQFAGQP
jgi:biopolymer transport protein ExbD